MIALRDKGKGLSASKSDRRCVKTVRREVARSMWKRVTEGASHSHGLTRIQHNQGTPCSPCNCGTPRRSPSACPSICLVWVHNEGAGEDRDFVEYILYTGCTVLYLLYTVEYTTGQRTSFV